MFYLEVLTLIKLILQKSYVADKEIKISARKKFGSVLFDISLLDLEKT